MTIYCLLHTSQVDGLPIQATCTLKTDTFRVTIAVMRKTKLVDVGEATHASEGTYCTYQIPPPCLPTQN